MQHLDIFANRNRLPMPESRDEFWARKRADALDAEKLPHFGQLFRNR